jgi:hypothetical protein
MCSYQGNFHHFNYVLPNNQLPAIHETITKPGLTRDRFIHSFNFRLTVQPSSSFSHPVVANVLGFDIVGFILVTL